MTTLASPTPIPLYDAVSTELEPDQAWKDALQAKIEDSLSSMAQDAKKIYHSELSKGTLPDAQRESIIRKFNETMNNIRKLAQDTFLVELERERHERRWAAEVNMIVSCNEALVQEQQDTMNRIMETRIDTQSISAPEQSSSLSGPSSSFHAQNGVMTQQLAEGRRERSSDGMEHLNQRHKSLSITQSFQLPPDSPTIMEQQRQQEEKAHCILERKERERQEERHGKTDQEKERLQKDKKEQEVRRKEEEVRRKAEEVRRKEVAAREEARRVREETWKREQEMKFQEEELKKREELQRREREIKAERLQKEVEKSQKEAERLQKQFDEEEEQRRLKEQWKREEKFRYEQQQEELRRHEQEIHERKRQDSMGGSFPSSYTSSSSFSAHSYPHTSAMSINGQTPSWSSLPKPNAASKASSASTASKSRSGSMNALFPTSTPSSHPSPAFDEAEFKRKQEEFSQQQQEKFRKEQLRFEETRQRTESPEQVLSTLERHEYQWNILISSATSLHWGSIPWPMFFPPQSPEDITLSTVTTYLQSPLLPDREKAKPLRDRLQEMIKKWHPDWFEAKYLPRIIGVDRERVKEGTRMVIRFLNELLTQETWQREQELKYSEEGLRQMEKELIKREKELRKREEEFSEKEEFRKKEEFQRRGREISVDQDHARESSYTPSCQRSLME